MSRPTDITQSSSCNPLINSMQLCAVNGAWNLRAYIRIVPGTSRINNPEGDVYESRDRFEGGCRGSRGGTCRLSGSEAPPGGCRRPQVTGSEAAVRCGINQVIRGSGHQYC